MLVLNINQEESLTLRLVSKMSFLRKKTRYILLIIVFGILFSSIAIDRGFWLSKRVENNLWEYRKGLYIGEFISNDKYMIENGTLCFFSGEKYFLIGTIFNKLYIYDPLGKKIGCYDRFLGSKRW